jgi:hypothetical protein
VSQHLAEHASRLVSKDEPFAAAWPDVTITDVADHCSDVAGHLAGYSRTGEAAPRHDRRGAARGWSNRRPPS